MTYREKVIEAALTAFLREGENWMFASNGGNTPMRVYRMVNAMEDDTPVFIGPDIECYRFVWRHQLGAALTAILAATEEPTEEMVAAGRLEMPAEARYWQRDGALHCEIIAQADCVSPAKPWRAMHAALTKAMTEGT